MSFNHIPKDYKIASEMGDYVGRWVAKPGVAKLVARLLAMAALWVRIQTSLKNTKWATYAKEYMATTLAHQISSVLRVRDVFLDPGSDFFPSRIPDAHKRI
jgi:hypothetical protein